MTSNRCLSTKCAIQSHLPITPMYTHAIVSSLSTEPLSQQICIFQNLLDSRADKQKPWASKSNFRTSWKVRIKMVMITIQPVQLLGGLFPLKTLPSPKAPAVQWDLKDWTHSPHAFYRKQVLTVSSPLRPIQKEILKKQTFFKGGEDEHPKTLGANLQLLTRHLPTILLLPLKSVFSRTETKGKIEWEMRNIAFLCDILFLNVFLSCIPVHSRFTGLQEHKGINHAWWVPGSCRGKELKHAATEKPQLLLQRSSHQ